MAFRFTALRLPAVPSGAGGVCNSAFTVAPNRRGVKVWGKAPCWRVDFRPHLAGHSANRPTVGQILVSRTPQLQAQESDPVRVELSSVDRKPRRTQPTVNLGHTTTSRRRSRQERVRRGKPGLFLNWCGTPLLRRLPREASALRPLETSTSGSDNSGRGQAPGLLRDSADQP